MRRGIDFRTLGHGKTPSHRTYWVVTSRGTRLKAAYFIKKGYAEELQESDLTLKVWRRNSVTCLVTKINTKLA